MSLKGLLDSDCSGSQCRLCVLIGGAVLRPSRRPRARRSRTRSCRTRSRSRSAGRRRTRQDADLRGVSQMLLEQTGELSAAPSALGFSRRRRDARSKAATRVFQGNGQTNMRVNQDCSLRAQAGEQIAVNPLDPNNVLVGQNDSRNRFNRCGVAWSSTGARLGRRDAAVLPGSADWTSTPATAARSDRGLGLAGQLPTSRHGLTESARTPRQNAVVVAKSNPGIDGAYFHSPDSSDGFQEYRSMPLGVRRASTTERRRSDKPLIARTQHDEPKARLPVPDVDAVRPGAGIGDGPDGIRQIFPIFFSQSDDGGVTWTLPIEINGRRLRRHLPDLSATSTTARTGRGPGRIDLRLVRERQRDRRARRELLMVKCPVADEDCTRTRPGRNP